MDNNSWDQHILDASERMRRFGAECTVLLKKDGTFPLSSPCKVALYGNGAKHTVYGGTGSGEVNTDDLVSIFAGLTNAGFQVTTSGWLEEYDKVLEKAKKRFQKDLQKEAFRKHTLTALVAMGRVMKEPEYEIPMSEFDEPDCDLAIYVLSRVSGEGADREVQDGEILLTRTEIRDILKANEAFEKFVLVLNTCGVVDLSPVKEVKNILVLSQPGGQAGNILADLLLGKSTPSGHLTTTWAAWKDYCPHGDFGEPDETRYREGIYVGYRYFDTLGIEPVFPFGHGLTYTEFEIVPVLVEFIDSADSLDSGNSLNSDKSLNSSNSSDESSLTGSGISVRAKVRNVGSFSGKEVLQLYVSAPSGKLDRPYQELAAFQKTKELTPGEEEELTITFSVRDLAVYDPERAVYVLEEGDYLLRLGNSSRNTVLCGAVKVPEEIMCAEAENVIGTPDFTDYRPGEEAVDNHADIMSAPVAFPVLVLRPEMIPTISLKEEEEKSPEDLDPTVRAMEVEDLIRMTLGHYSTGFSISSMVGNSGFTVAGAAGETYLGAKELGVPSLVMADGPAGLRLARKCAVDAQGISHSLDLPLPESMHEYLPGWVVSFLKHESYKPKEGDRILEQKVTALPVETALAQSFDCKLMEACGDLVGEEMAHYGVHLWLAPALNIHRDIRCGRNYEYYSEDPVLSGLMAAAITRGVQRHPGCGVTLKHLAANNQEHTRMQNNSQVSERAFREIYMKGFAMAIRLSAPKALMTSYNLINGTHAGEHDGMIQGILRRELNYQGLVMTDWVFKKSPKNPLSPHPMSLAPLVIGAGGDLFMPGSSGDQKDMKAALRRGTLTRAALRQSASRVATLAKELNK